LGRTAPLFVLAAALGFAGGGGSNGPAKPSVACDDASFRAQDEELYVTRSSITTALARSGGPATLVLDLRRARKVLSEYLAAHPRVTPDSRASPSTSGRQLTRSATRSRRPMEATTQRLL